MRHAAYQSSVPEFVAASDSEVLGALASGIGFELSLLQNIAWQGQIACLKAALTDHSSGTIFLEFVIPRMGKRADALLLTNNMVVVIEFKVGSEAFERHAIEQVHDYALDLKNFHLGSHEVPIVPVVVATEAPSPQAQMLNWAKDNVAMPLLASAASLPRLLQQVIASPVWKAIDPEEWLASGYRPTPTIIEAAQALYEHHGVEDITRSDAGAKNLSDTTAAIQRVIEAAKARRQKAICFVTGVPGAGKTLAGLNIATKRADEHADEHAVFLSGNGPLVTVLQEALARDKAKRDGISQKEALRAVKTFIQPIHHFRDEYIRDQAAPVERVAIFDEAQRAWTKDKAVKFMRERGNHVFDASEPEFLISVMDRHDDWAVIICLVGGGQEINTGEAGLGEWMASLSAKYPEWQVFMSDRLSDPDYQAIGVNRQNPMPAAALDENLHLSVSMRSFRAEKISAFVGLILSNEPGRARAVLEEMRDRYPIVLTRDLATARDWVRRRARGSERYGLLASSGARRLRPEGIEIRQKVDAAAWFLSDRDDVRSSYYCEEVATEFDVQGLELDWTAVCWDADLRFMAGKWEHFDFKGTRWQQVRSVEGRVYLTNAYRVLLTRARQGMVIYVPRGDDRDGTRPRSIYDGTYRFFELCGVGLAN